MKTDLEKMGVQKSIWEINSKVDRNGVPGRIYQAYQKCAAKIEKEWYPLIKIKHVLNQATADALLEIWKWGSQESSVADLTLQTLSNYYLKREE